MVLVTVTGGLLSLLVHYGYVVGQVFEARALREQNKELKDRLAELQTRVDDVDQRLVQLRVFDEKLRALTDLRDDERGLSMGPLRQNPQGGADVPTALRAGVDAAYASVPEPVEGTMLTVARAAADACEIGRAHV